MSEKSMRAILKQLCSFLAIYAIALQAVLGVWAGAAQAAAATDPLSVLCRTAADGATLPERAPSSHGFDCICGAACTHMSTAALPGVTPAPPFMRVTAATRDSARIEAERAIVLHCCAQPRAPPVGV